MSKMVGIIGGMGPMATIDLFTKVVSNTYARCDQEHIHLLIDNNTSIPDRSSYILDGSDSPLPELLASANRLIKSGADILAMPCNTAHYFYDAIAQELPDNIIFLNMIEETCERISSSDNKNIMLLATQGTYSSGIYDLWCDRYDIKISLPCLSIRQHIMDSIYAYKSGSKSYMASIKYVVEYANHQGIDNLVLGCTELPLIFADLSDQFTLIDPSNILAQKIVSLSNYNVEALSP